MVFSFSSVSSLLISSVERKLELRPEILLLNYLSSADASDDCSISIASILVDAFLSKYGVPSRNFSIM